MDSDDWYDLRFVEFMHKALVETGSDIAECDYVYTDKDESNESHDVSVRSVKTFTGRECFHQYLQTTFFVSVWNKLYRREMIDGIPFEKGKYHEDDFWTYQVFDRIEKLALVEKPSFHMRDTVEAQNIVRSHRMEPIADCELVGPIPWDLIVSKEAARLKEYDCPYCGEFDAVLMPSAMAGNTVMKVLTMSANVNACGVLAGTKVPVAIASRSSSEEQAYLSLCVAAAMLYEDKK